MPLSFINGFVLAGGKSSRMGRDKAMLDWHGRTLIAHMVDLLEAAADHVQVVGRDLLPDRAPGRGPLSGIATALEISPTDANIIVAVDLPFLTKDFLLYFRARLEQSSGSRLLVCKMGSDFPLCLGVRKTALAAVQDHLSSDDWSLHGWITDSGVEVISERQLQSAGFEPEIFRNLNTPEDYERAISLSDGPSSVPGVG